MNDFLKTNGFSVAALTQIGLIVLSAVLIFGTLRADVGYLKDQLAMKENKEVADGRMDSILREINHIRADIRRVETKVDAIHAGL